MTGSGKTGLGIVLLEEALAKGVPALILDPKGDMGNLALTFPDLSAASFRPWIDESAARDAGRRRTSTRRRRLSSGKADWSARESARSGSRRSATQPT